MVDTAIYIGRFEPVHNGHMALLQRALDSAQQVIVVVGSAWQARSPKNPFTWQEREAMLRNALPEADRSRMVVLPMRDYYNEAVWVQAVRQGVARLTTPGARIGLVGHFKDATSGYLSAQQVGADIHVVFDPDGQGAGVASPLTLVNYLLLGCASGLTLATALAARATSTSLACSRPCMRSLASYCSVAAA